jgi:UDP-N-acetylglucosamine--N-acetylmuramyl-(pentapeptide) pyrophosphoryl-undecaprenol N-acetylglucosamine transferase
MGKTVLIAAGGTGGHLYPGLAVADELRRRDPETRVVFVGTRRGLESRIVPPTGYPLELLPILPLNQVGTGRLLLGLLALPHGLLRAALVVLRERPRAVLGVGGYAGGPVTLAAALLGVRTVILEPNAKPGFTNRALRPLVRKAACAWDEARAFYGAKGVLTGNPVRGGFAALGRREAGTPASLLAFGGSQGSRVLNEAMVAALPGLPGPEALRIVHQTGPAMHEAVAAAYAKAPREAEVTPYLADMERRFAEADLVVSRSGATTCAELQAAGKASVLVPFARSAEDHQRQNAAAMAAEGAAVMLEEKDLSGESLARAVSGLLADKTRLRAMGEAARRMSRPDAASRVADLVLEEP